MSTPPSSVPSQWAELGDAAQAQRKVAEALAGVGNADNAFAQLGRFEESVAREEATAKAFNQIGSAGKDEDLEKEFAALEGSSVDDELAALKRERQIRPPELPRELPAAPE
jgi:phage shock protein A